MKNGDQWSDLKGCTNVQASVIYEVLTEKTESSVKVVF